MRPSRRAWALLVLAALAAGALAYSLRRPAACWACDRPIHAGMAAEIKTGLFWRKTCCLRCALNYAQERPGAVKAYRVTDYATRRRLDAQDAFYVVGSDVLPCHGMGARQVEPGMAAAPKWDRCVPSTIAFADKAAAQGFLRRHGGRLLSWDELSGKSP